MGNKTITALVQCHSMKWENRSFFAVPQCYLRCATIIEIELVPFINNDFTLLGEDQFKFDNVQYTHFSVPMACLGQKGTGQLDSAL